MEKIMLDDMIKALRCVSSQDVEVDCYTEEKKTYTCDKCGKKFTMYGYQAGWRYQTETIDGEATKEQVERIVGIGGDEK